ncbi:hypothetical protein SEA_KNOCKER_77 [Mycobacterium phage Knocker]|nr:hypothetical protein SEA_KNOCKER_77 [Mycobacterium phage Knocker]
MRATSRIWAYRINTIAIGLAFLATVVAPMPVWWPSVVATIAGAWCAQLAVTKVRQQRDEGVFEAVEPATAGAETVEIKHQCDTPMCPCRGEVYDLCTGCGKTPNRRLMAWTAEGTYRCRMCRTADGTPEEPAPAVQRLLDTMSVAEAEGAAMVPIIVTAPGSAFRTDGRMMS